jgi:hypothetical protein
MKPFFLSLSLSFFIIACGSSSTDNSNTTDITAEETDSSQVNDSTGIVEETVDTLERDWGPILDESSLIRPSIFQLNGSIDGKYVISMSLSYDYGKFKDPDNDEKISVTGSYKYKTSSSSLALTGEIDTKTEIMTLAFMKNGEKDEIFSGKYNDNFESYAGNWEKTKKNKTLSFQLNKTPSSIPLETQKLFAQKLNEIFSEASKNNLLPTNKVGVDRYGLYIQDSIDWYPSGKLSNSLFQATTWYESTAMGWEYKILAHLFQIENSEDFVIYMKSNFSSYNITEDEEETPGEEEDIIAIWKYDGTDFIDIFEKKDSQLGWTGANTSDVVNHVRVEKITVSNTTENKIWVWDAKKELLVLK